MFLGKRLVPLQEFAPEAQMTLNSIHRDRLVQKAGQALGAALPLQPLPRILTILAFRAQRGISRLLKANCYYARLLCVGAPHAAPHLGTQLKPAPQVFTDDAVRVAGGITPSQKTSTAALASFRFGVFPNQRRALRHPKPYPSLQCQSTNQEDTMHVITSRRSFAAIIPVIFRITLSLLLWTLGASAMDLRIAPVPPKDHRVVLTFPVDRAKAEALQRWVNAGHDSWCRDPQAVAAATLRRVSPDLAEFEPIALPLELESSQKTKVVYTFHSLDGRSTYRITLLRYRFLLSTSGSLRQTIWTPESVEIITRDTRE